MAIISKSGPTPVTLVNPVKTVIFTVPGSKSGILLTFPLSDPTGAHTIYQKCQKSDKTVQVGSPDWKSVNLLKDEVGQSVGLGPVMTKKSH